MAALCGPEALAQPAPGRSLGRIQHLALRRFPRPRPCRRGCVTRSDRHAARPRGDRSPL